MIIPFSLIETELLRWSTSDYESHLFGSSDMGYLLESCRLMNRACIYYEEFTKTILYPFIIGKIRRC